MPDDIITRIYKDLKKRVDDLEVVVRNLRKQSEASTYTKGLQSYAYADLPTSGLGDNASYITLVFVPDGRKSGESAGNGTGVIAYWDTTASDWLNVADYSSVQI